MSLRNIIIPILNRLQCWFCSPVAFIFCNFFSIHSFLLLFIVKQISMMHSWNTHIHTHLINGYFTGEPGLSSCCPLLHFVLNLCILLGLVKTFHETIPPSFFWHPISLPPLHTTLSSQHPLYISVCKRSQCTTHNQQVDWFRFKKVLHWNTFHVLVLLYELALFHVAGLFFL